MPKYDIRNTDGAGNKGTPEAAKNSLNPADLKALDQLKVFEEGQEEEEKDYEVDTDILSHKYHLQTKKFRTSFCVDCQMYLGRKPKFEVEQTEDEDETI